MKKKKLRAGVVGVGSIGRNHARIYASLANAELAAIYDIDRGVAEDTARKYGARAVASLEEFAEFTDAASVATPTSFHHSIAIYLMERGVDVLVEKPIADTPAEATEMVARSRGLGRVLQVGHIERFNPVLDLIGSQTGIPRFIESHRLSPYPNRSTEIGVVMDLMIHDIEIVLHLVKSPIASIDAVGVPVLSKGEDIANARLRFENGCVANLTASRISPEKMRKLRLFSTEAYLSLDYQNQAGEIYRRENHQITRHKVVVAKAEPLALELEAFVTCCLTRGTPKVSGGEAAAALEVADRITQLVHSAGAITLV